MIHIIRTNSENTDFVSMVKMLDADLAIRDGEDHPFYAQYNKLDDIKHVMVAFINGQPAGCGAIKEFSPGVMEVKRMFTLPEYRGKGVASALLSVLEKWAAELGYNKCILETGKKQPEAIALYHKNGYAIIDNYGQYANVQNSLCFEKKLYNSPA